MVQLMGAGQSQSLSSSAKIVAFAVVSIGERVIAIEDEIQIMKEVHNRWSRGHCEQTRRFVSLAVEMLIPSVQRRRKRANRHAIQKSVYFDRYARRLSHRGR